MSIIKKVLSILLGISALGIIASNVTVMILSNNTEIVQFTYTAPLGDDYGTIDTSTYMTLKNLHDDGYRLYAVDYYNAVTATTTTYTNTTLRYNSILTDLLVDIMPATGWFAITPSDTLIVTGYAAIADQDTFIFTLTKPILDTTNIMLLGLIPMVFVSGLILYINVFKKES